MAVAFHSGGKVSRSVQDMPDSMKVLSAAEREFLSGRYELHIDNGIDIHNAINNLGIDVPNISYGKITGLRHQNKIIVTRKGIDNGDLIHEAGHAIDTMHGNISTYNTPGHDEFALMLNGAISRELTASGSVHPHFDTRKSAGSAARERFAELFSQYRSGTRRYQLGSKLSAELSAKLTDYFDRTLGE